MSTRHLDRLFTPRCIAVIGAGERPGGVGRAVLANLRAAGFVGQVHVVHPRRDAIAGVPAVASIAALPALPDLAVVCTPAEAVPEVIEQCGAAGVPAAVIISAGFGEAGPEGVAREQRLRAVMRRYRDLRVLGPNCLGLAVPSVGLDATFGPGMPPDGSIAFFTQSGAVGTAVQDWAREAGVGCSALVSVGNMIDVDFADLIDHVAADGRTRAILMHIETIREPRRFLSAARAFTRTQPIIACKAGRFEASGHAVRSHTGRMAGADAVYDAAFERAGIVRVDGLEALLDGARALARHRPPEGDRLAILSNAGGLGVMALDRLLAGGGTPAELSADAMRRLGDLLPAAWSRGNPVDVLGDAAPERYAAALDIVLADPGVDAVLAILTPQAMTDATRTAERVAAVAAGRRAMLLAAWVGGASMHEGRARLERAGVPAFASFEAAMRAFETLSQVERRRRLRLETPRPRPAAWFDGGGTWRGRSLLQLAADDQDTLTDPASRRVLRDHGIAVVGSAIATTPEEAVREARGMGGPVAIKVLSPQITHKTDVGGVVLDVEGEQAVVAAFERVTAAARAARPAARIEGVVVQPMVRAAGAVELILGVRTDPNFGPAIVLGAGGIAAEVLEDRAVGLPPLDEPAARHMLESLRCHRLLGGLRGRPRLDVTGVLETMIRFSELVAEHPEIREADLNPLLVMPEGVLVLDARFVLDPAWRGRAIEPSRHLAILPFPRSPVRRATLPGGESLVLRPIRPEDEPRWVAMIERCSPASIRQRFRGTFAAPTHRMAARFCRIDYDREMAIVAEDGGGMLVGVGRLTADADRRVADVSVLVEDRWQGRGLGSRLADACLDVARDWGIERVEAEVPPGGDPMRSILEDLDFAAAGGEPDGLMVLEPLVGRAAATAVATASPAGITAS